MNKIITGIFCSFVFCSSFVHAEEDGYESFGGALIRKGSYSGKVTIANCQEGLPMSNLVAVAKLLEDMIEVRLETVSLKYTSPAEMLKASGAAVLIAVISDPEQPTMLVAPEERWCVVNLAKLVDDLPAERAKKKFFSARARKEIIKAATLVCGGGASQYPGNIMNTANVRELDYVKETLPADKVAACRIHLKKLGVTPKDLVTYEEACQEGWAPAPTNDVQKAIWDKVHAPPEKPIKITYDKDKQKPVVK